MTMRLKRLFRLSFFVSGAWKIMGFATTNVKLEGGGAKKLQFAFLSTNETPESDTASRYNSPEILQPFLPAADPKWACYGPVGEGNFVLIRTGGPTSVELSNENILKIVKLECTDLDVNTLVWKCLGYRFNTDTEEWSASECFPNWRDKHPSPPDFIGMQRM
jgi:hypothetical protein